jgi:hypothetical protein
VNITGTNLAGVTEVKIGNITVAFTINSATSITATVGSGPGGEIIITSPQGTVSKSGFVYLPSIIANSSTTFLTGGSVTLKEPTGFISGYTYKWAKDGIDIPNVLEPSYTVTQSGSYTVSMITGNQTVTSAPVVVKVAFTLPVNNYPGCRSIMRLLLQVLTLTAPLLLLIIL